MRTLIAASVASLLLAATADAQVRIFLDPAGVGENDDRGAVDPLSYGNPVVPRDIPTRLYIYGEFLNENDLWLAINFDLTTDGDVTLSDPTRYIHRTGNGPRWNGGFIRLNNPQNASFRSAWVGNSAEFAGGMWNWDEAKATARTGDPFNAADNSDNKHYRRGWDSQGSGLGTTLLGYVDVEGSQGNLWMTVESPIFARLGATPDDFVHFGYGDASVTTGSIGVRTTIADATIGAPEPTSLMLLGLGGLALRRRR